MVRSNRNFKVSSLVAAGLLLFVLLVLSAGGTVWAAPDAQGTVPPPPPPPPTTGGIGAAGGTLTSPGGDSTITIPGGVVPDNSTYSVYRPRMNSLPTGTFTIRGDGDHIVSVIVTGPDGKSITSFSTNITICFNLSAAEVAAAGGPGNVTIQWFNSTTGKWETLTTTQTPGTNQFCVSVNHLSIYGIFAKPASSAPIAENFDSSNLGAILPLALGLAGVIALGAIWMRRPKK